MPHKINITRGAAAPVMARGDVEPGMVFAVKDARTGKLGVNYAAIGMNGRMYSVNLSTGELASSANREGNVTLTGKWEFNVSRQWNRGSRIGRDVLRRDVQPGEVFMVKGGEDEYAHLGRITRDHLGWLSVPLARQHNHAVTSNGDSHVTIVGTFALDVVAAK